MPCCKWLYHPLSWVVAASTVGIATIIPGRPTCRQPGALGSAGPLFSRESWPPKAGWRVIFRTLWFSIRLRGGNCSVGELHRSLPERCCKTLLWKSQFAALCLHREGRFNLTCSCFFCALTGRGGTTSGFLRIISCQWFSPKAKESCNLLFQLPGRMLGTELGCAGCVFGSHG